MRSIWRTLDRGTARDIALVCLADALVGASFGAIAVSGGLDWWVPVLMSVVVFAGGAQFAAIGVVLSGGSAAAAVATGLVLNARLLPFGFTVADTLGRRAWTRALGAHLTTDESVAFVLRHRDPARRRAAFWACGIGLFAAWNLAVGAGAAAGSAIGDTDALGLDAAFPAVLLALVWPTLAAEPTTRNAALLGAAVAVAATPFLPAGVPVLLALTGLAVAVRRPRPLRPLRPHRNAGPDSPDGPDRDPAAPLPQARGGSAHREAAPADRTPDRGPTDHHHGHPKAPDGDPAAPTTPAERPAEASPASAAPTTAPAHPARPNSPGETRP